MSSTGIPKKKRFKEPPRSDYVVKPNAEGGYSVACNGRDVGRAFDDEKAAHDWVAEQVPLSTILSAALESNDRAVAEQIYIRRTAGLWVDDAHYRHTSRYRPELDPSRVGIKVSVLLASLALPPALYWPVIEVMHFPILGAFKRAQKGAHRDLCLEHGVDLPFSYVQAAAHQLAGRFRPPDGKMTHDHPALQQYEADFQREIVSGLRRYVSHPGSPGLVALAEKTAEAAAEKEAATDLASRVASVKPAAVTAATATRPPVWSQLPERPKTRPRSDYVVKATGTGCYVVEHNDFDVGQRFDTAHAAHEWIAMQVPLSTILAAELEDSDRRLAEHAYLRRSAGLWAEDEDVARYETYRRTSKYAGDDGELHAQRSAESSAKALVDGLLLPPAPPSVALPPMDRPFLHALRRLMNDAHRRLLIEHGVDLPYSYVEAVASHVVVGWRRQHGALYPATPGKVPAFERDVALGIVESVQEYLANPGVGFDDMHVKLHSSVPVSKRHTRTAASGGRAAASARNRKK